MNIAIIIAGGSGKRTGQDVPKQFLTVNDKPIIVYTLENFQNNPLIDGIVAVCIDGWQHVLEAYTRQFCITKLIGIVTGGESGQQRDPHRVQSHELGPVCGRKRLPDHNGCRDPDG